MQKSAFYSEFPAKCGPNTALFWFCLLWELKRESFHCEERLKCNISKYCSMNSNSFKKHTRTHSGAKPFQCKLCDFKSSDKGNLKRHTQNHIGNKYFPCTKCDYKSSDKGNLKRHEDTHNGVKPFKCAKCDFSSHQDI